MKPKTNIYRTPEGWGFEIVNTITRTFSEGYRTKAIARKAAREIRDGIKKNNNNNKY